ncbi:MAG: Rab GTPase domain-containing protein [Candidatus Woesebacteria bacterium GW2011_GWA1_37_7]|uniref:Rab GTPase domain-containing protein n=1 Tax=Candidatus Woesebacteria bacterium GW2011_GWA1_37_7 TaxID=1618545 RepID=A0A0G0HHM2_9BACT|nr:MAG: Rab GTPase domain-containing protein [Candidatus Woesebacteria bacterium GW2011_GWA1_37_7]
MIRLKKFFLKLLTLFSVINLVFAPSVLALELNISGNGDGSESSASTVIETTTTVIQENNLNVDNNLSTDANTGGNSVSGNTNSDINIETGNITQSVTVENNGNFSSVDIPCCQESSEIEVVNNGSDSINSINLTQSNSTNVIVSQNVNISNTINGYANTGDNSANNNTQGSVLISSGNIKVSGGIMNGPLNLSSITAGTGGFGILASINQNGANSDSKIYADFNNETNIFQLFHADIGNFVNWRLNTGGNEASENTGSDIDIKTGGIEFDFFIRNLLNIGKVDLGCCVFDPGDPAIEEEPAEEDVEQDEEDEEDGDNDNDDDDGGDGEILPSAAATEAGGPGIAGLSDTSSGQAQTIIFFAGLLLITLGIRFIGQHFASEKIK